MCPRLNNFNNISQPDINYVMVDDEKENINPNTNTNTNPNTNDDDDIINDVILGLSLIEDEDLIPPRIIDELREKGLLIVNVPRDGNCMFHAIANHLPSIDYFRLRKSVVWYLKQRENIFIEYLNKTYKELFQDMDDSFGKNWDNFIKYIGGDGNWEKMPAEYILKIISEMYNLEINIYSTINNNKQQITGFISDIFNLRPIYLIHLAEMHWCSTSDFQNNTTSQNNTTFQNNTTPSYIS